MAEEGNLKAKRFNLSDKQKRFADIYFVSQNAKAAALEAGYPPNSAHVTASRLKHSPKIKSYLESRAEEFALANREALQNYALQLSKKDAVIKKAYECFEEIKDPKNATKFKWFELICKILGHLDTQTRQTFNFNVDNRTLNHTEIVQGASEIAAKLANLAVFNPRIARNPMTIQHIDVPRETLSDADEDV